MKDINLTPTEWNLMECLWDHSPRTGREAVEYMKEHMGWSRSTTLTMLRRMSDKGFIACDKQGEVLSYSALLRREEAAVHETRSFINRVYKGSVSMLVNAVTDKQELSREEIDRLYEILRKAEEKER